MEKIIALKVETKLALSFGSIAFLIVGLARRAGASSLDAAAERMPASDQPGPEALGRRQLPLLESA